MGRSIVIRGSLQVSNKRRRSFNVALHCHDHEVVSLTDGAREMERQRLPGTRAKLAYFLAEEFSPGDDPETRKYYSLQYKCWPPPLFVPSVALLQVAIAHIHFPLLYTCLTGALFRILQSVGAGGAGRERSRSDRFAHHLSQRQTRGDLAVLLLRACPRRVGGERVDKANDITTKKERLQVVAPDFQPDGAAVNRSAARNGARKWSNRVRLFEWSGCGCVKWCRAVSRIRVLCFCIFSGSLAASVFDPDVYLVGGSGGVYALLAAHVANVFINFAHIDCGLCWVIVSVFVGAHRRSLNSVGGLID